MFNLKPPQLVAQDRGLIENILALFVSMFINFKKLEGVLHGVPSIKV